MTSLPARVTDSIRPSIIDTTRSAAPARLRSWVINTTVVPARARSASNSNTAWPLAWSSAPVGSSATISDDCVTVALAIPTRCCSPPLIWAGSFLAWPANPTRSSAATAVVRRRRRPTSVPRSSASSTFSTAVRVGSRWKSWNTIPTLPPRHAASRSVFIRSIRVPLTTSDPEVGLSMPAIRAPSVLLPEPDGPITATSSPERMSRSTPVIPIWAASPLPQIRVRSRASTSEVSTAGGAAGTRVRTEVAFMPPSSGILGSGDMEAAGEPTVGTAPPRRASPAQLIEARFRNTVTITTLSSTIASIVTVVRARRATVARSGSRSRAGTRTKWL